MFRKTARVSSLGTFDVETDGHIRVAQLDNEEAPRSYYLDGTRKLDVRGLLEKVSSLYGVSANPEDYFFEAIRANTTNCPNENNDGFHYNELTRFDMKLGMPVYMTYAGKPHHLNHKTDNPKAARGVVIDAHYNSDSPPLESCPGCMSRTAERQHRDESGLHCKRCGTLVKDEFVEILVGIDSKKDPLFAEGVRKGTLKAGSMGCFLPGTGITMADGTRQPIETIRPGDRVVTHTGKVAEVAETSVHEHEDDVYRIEVQGVMDPIVATGNHPFWVVDPETGKGVWTEADQLRAGQYLRCPAVRYETSKVANDFARLVGYFVSEGSFIKAYDGPHKGSRVGLEFTFSSSEQHYVDEVVSLLKKYGNNPNTYARPSRNTITVKDYRCQDLTERMFSLVGQHAIDKTLSSEVLAWPREAQLHFIGAWLNGDGYSIHDGGPEKAGHSWSAITTSSENLRDQLSQMFCNLGVPHRVGKQPSSFSSRVAANITIIGNAQLLFAEYSDKIKRPQGIVEKKSTFADNDGLLRRVRSVVAEPYEGPVYNFEVADEDHSYVAGGVAVHNCNCLSTVCNVCSHVAYSRPEFCEHIRSGNKGTLWARKGSHWVKTNAADVAKELRRRKLAYVSRDFCYVKAGDFEVRKAFEYCVGVIFDEYSRVDQPADPKALQVEILKAAQVTGYADTVQPDALRAETEALIRSAEKKRKELEARMHVAAGRRTAGKFFVVRINQDPSDTHAGASLEEALDLAQPDESDLIEYGLVSAPDAGAARLLEPDAWMVVDESTPGAEASMDQQALELQLQPGDDPLTIAPPNGPGGEPDQPGAPAPGRPQGIEQYTEQQTPPEGEEMNLGEMGVLPVAPGASAPRRGARRPSNMKFQAAYRQWTVQVSEQGNARLLTQDRAPVLVFKAAKATQDPEARKAFGKQVLAHLLEHGLVATAKKYKGFFSPRFAQVVEGGMNDMQSFKDHFSGSVLEGASGQDDMPGDVRGGSPPKDVSSSSAEHDDMQGDVRGKPPADTGADGAMDHERKDQGIDSAVREDHETMREKRKPFNMGKSDVLSGGAHDHVEPLGGKKGEVEINAMLVGQRVARTVGGGSFQIVAARIGEDGLEFDLMGASKQVKKAAASALEAWFLLDKGPSMLKLPGKPAMVVGGVVTAAEKCGKCGESVSKDAEHKCSKMEAEVEATPSDKKAERLEKLAAAKLAKAEKLLEEGKLLEAERIASAQKAAVASFCRAMRIAAARQSVDLEQSPLKMAAEAVLSEPRTIGKDAATGEPVVFKGLDPELTRYMVAQLYSIGHADHLETLIKRASELSQKGDQYLIDAETDLRNVKASLPEITNAHTAEIDEAGLRAMELREQARTGNLQLNPAPSEAVNGHNGHNRRTAIRGALGGTLVEAARGRLGLSN